MPKPIVRASEREAIFREADVLDLYNKYGPPDKVLAPKDRAHSPEEEAHAPGAAEWEHDHPGKHLFHKRPNKLTAPDPEVIYGALGLFARDVYEHFQDWPDHKLHGYHHYLTHSQFADSEDHATAAAIKAELERRKDHLAPHHRHTAKHHYPSKWEEFSHDDKDLPAYEVTEAHDWLQHTLGDAEHWEEERGNKHEAAGPAELPQGLDYYQDAPGSSHSAQIYRDPKTQENWLVKHAPKSAKFLADGDVAASQIASMSGLETPATFKTDLGKGPASAQYMYPGAKDAWSGPPNPEKINDNDLMTIQKHHALDWMIGNHDSHERQFIRGQDGQLIGIDKGQAFKYFNNDRLHWNFHPNSLYGEHEPIYNTLYRNFAQGGRQLFDPRDGEYGKYIQGLQSIPDDHYREMLRPYAEGAAKAGQLGTFTHPGYDGWAKGQRFQPNDVEGFLDSAVSRKNTLTDQLGDLYDRAQAHRSTGEKIARRHQFAAAPDPALFKSMHQELGSHGAKVYSDPQGQWLIKHPPQGASFMVPLDRATAQLQERAGLEGPETHTVPWKDGTHVTAVKMIPGATQAFQNPPRLTDTHPDDLAALQRHQALDWLISNHDGHVGNFMRGPEGQLLGIDKGQAAKYYGRDRLDQSFHPNFYAREPVYNQLWRDYAAGHEGQMADPRTGEYGQFVQRLKEIPDHELKNMFRPYAEEAAAAGLLANPRDNHDGSVDPRRGLGEPTFAPNDPEAFLEAMAQRKNNLDKDLGALFDRAHAQRQQAQAQMNRFPKHLDTGPEPKHYAPQEDYQPLHAQQPMSQHDPFDPTMNGGYKPPPGAWKTKKKPKLLVSPSEQFDPQEA